MASCWMPPLVRGFSSPPERVMPPLVRGLSSRPERALLPLMCGLSPPPDRGLLPLVRGYFSPLKRGSWPAALVRVSWPAVLRAALGAPPRHAAFWCAASAPGPSGPASASCWAFSPRCSRTLGFPWRVLRASYHLPFSRDRASPAQARRHADAAVLPTLAARAHSANKIPGRLLYYNR